LIPRLGCGAAALALLLALAASCTLARPLHGLTCEPGAGNASCLYGQSCESDGDCATASCVSSSCQCPLDMVTIESRFCVDATEVTNAAYRRFLAASPNPSAQESICQWNADFNFDDGAGGPDVCKTRHKEDDYPATCVNWCDAHAFCKSLGKHLCGKMHGGPNPDSAYADAARSEWFDACSKGGTLIFPTGDYDPQACNVDSSGPVPAGPPGKEVCEGGYLGLQHMSGNVREWEDSCTGETGAGDACLTRGGAFDSGGAASDGKAPDLQCDVHDSNTRDDTDYAIGFRCCSG
jgi:formylglycine-generating enzyme